MKASEYREKIFVSEPLRKVAAESTMRMQIMDKIMEHTKGDSTGMIKMMHDGMMDGKMMNRYIH